MSALLDFPLTEHYHFNMKLIQHGRYNYSPIFDRPVYDWPNGKRLAVYFAINIEHFEFGAFRGRGDEFVCHGRTNCERQAELNEEEETRLIRDATEDYKKHEGGQPEGWLGPWISQSEVTPDLLKEHGYSYMLDWPVDDQPI